MTTIDQEILALVREHPPKTSGRPRKRVGDEACLEVDAGETSRDGPVQAIERRERNAHLALDHFGFGALFWPTYQDLADHHEGLGTRERVRQILNECVYDHFSGSPRPAASAAAALIESRSFWPEDELLASLAEEGLVEGLAYARGLLDYLQAQDLVPGWTVVKPDLKEAGRKTYHEHEQCFVVSPERKRQLAKVVRRARKIVGLNGLCRLAHVGADADTAPCLLALLKAHNEAWVTRREQAVWYTFTDRHRSLVGAAAKIFSIVESCNLEHLAEMLRNALHARNSKFDEYPDASLIEEWITRSDRFRVDGSSVSFRDEAGELTEIEADLVEVLGGRGPGEPADVIRDLVARGHGKPYATKIAYHSALVHLDRSGGRKNYHVTLATDLPAGEPAELDDYSIFRARLGALAATDRQVDGTAREEQRLLSEWIFRGATHDRCAICDREFARGALITAHKKKRAYCTETERRDPHIVFPLCAFGCDYLYERDFVRVVNGLVTRGRTATGRTEADIIERHLGRRLDARWLAGPEDYFDMTSEAIPGAEDLEAA